LYNTTVCDVAFSLKKLM